MIPEYFAILMDQAQYINYQMNCLGKGVIMHGLNSSIIKELFILIPPIVEQKKILKKIEENPIIVNIIKTKIRYQIERLQEYRTALITSAVTGKIDVRGEV